MTTSATAQAAATPVAIFTTHQNSARSLANASTSEMANTTNDAVAQIARRVSKRKNLLECRCVLRVKSMPDLPKLFEELPSAYVSVSHREALA